MKDSLSPVALSRLTWTFEDRQAWKDTYRAAIRINAVRSAYVLASAHRENEARYNARGPRIFDARRYSVHVDCMQGDAS